MRKINPDDYVGYQIVGRGWSCNITSFAEAKKIWADMDFGTLYGNKPNGNQAILDTKA